MLRVGKAADTSHCHTQQLGIVIPHPLVGQCINFAAFRVYSRLDLLVSVKEIGNIPRPKADISPGHGLAVIELQLPHLHLLKHGGISAQYAAPLRGNGDLTVGIFGYQVHKLLYPMAPAVKVGNHRRVSVDTAQVPVVGGGGLVGSSGIAAVRGGGISGTPAGTGAQGYCQNSQHQEQGDGMFPDPLHVCTSLFILRWMGHILQRPEAPGHKTKF